jgi:RHS repeat-associated protein
MYSDNGIRVEQKITDDTDLDGSFADETPVATKYLNDANNPTGYSQVLEERVSGNVTKSYTLGHDIIAQADATGTVYYLLKDGHGSTRALVNSSGQIVAGRAYSYDAYGNALGFTPADALTSHLYAGGQTDALTGLSYNLARYWDFGTGRFTTLDPAAGNTSDPLTFHKYVLTPGDPINFGDPTGWSFFAFDGTGNWEYEMNKGVWSPTNVWKMCAASMDINSHYYRGPGNEADYSGLEYLLGGMGGYGMAGILDTAWDDLLYDRSQGDYTADIVGFSRGGVEAIEFANRVADAFPDETIRFVGLYDPVGSVGLPGCFMNYRSQLPSGVQHAAEAIAMDEDRTFFPWTNVSGAVQKWFRGTHSDIGGWADHRLSDVTLQWMMGQAGMAGMSLNLSQTLAQTYQGQNLTFTPDPNAPINGNEGFTSWFTILGTVNRAAGVNSRPLCAFRPDSALWW